MLDRLKRGIEKIDAQYADIRYEEMQTVSVGFRGEELLSADTNFSSGYHIRILMDGGFAYSSFNEYGDLDRIIRRTAEAATLLSRHRKKKVTLAPVGLVKGQLIIRPEIDPRAIPLREKIALTRHYNDLVLGVQGIETTRMEYREVYRHKYFVSTEAAEISQELMTVNIYGSLLSKRGGLVEDVRVGIGGLDDYAKLVDREDHFEEKARICVDLLDAEPVKPGNYRVLLNPSIGGVFTHEAFGHFSEADLIQNNPALREKMQLGAKLGSDILTIIDDPLMEKTIGYYRYDDEGVAARKVCLMENGVLKGRLHSRETAHDFSEEPNGRAVTEDHSCTPIVRMSNIFIKPREESFDDLLAAVGNGLYLCDAKGGQTMGDVFSFGAQYGYLIRGGALGPLVRDINMSGNLFKTLKGIHHIGSDFVIKEVGGCGKGQLNIKSGHGGPHIVVDSVTIGGT
jgi:TldD protein